MGYQLKLVISSSVTSDLRAVIMSAAVARWPFCRGPRDPSAFTDRALIAPPELTDYLFDTDEDRERAIEQSYEVEDGLLEWSRQFPAVTFACIEADCFGGTCIYHGSTCRAGERLLVEKKGVKNDVRPLLRGVGLKSARSFAPFVRGFFAGRGSRTVT